MVKVKESSQKTSPLKDVQ